SRQRLLSCFLSTPLPASHTLSHSFFITRPPPRSSLFPYTTLFRSLHNFSCPLEALCEIFSDSLLNLFVVHNFSPLFEKHCNADRSEEHTSELQSREKLVCRLLLEKKNTNNRPASQDSRPTHRS